MVILGPCAESNLSQMISSASLRQETFCGVRPRQLQTTSLSKHELHIKTKKGRNAMEMESLKDLFVEELKDLYSAENQI